jgi:hypothetical protein
MNKKIINLGILLVFIFSCNVNTNNNNIEVKPTTSVSSNTSVLPTVTPFVQINTSATSTTNNIASPSASLPVAITSSSTNISSPSVSPTVDINHTSLPSSTITPSSKITSLPYTLNPENVDDFFNLNENNDGVANGYDGKVLIIIDTYLLKMFIKDEVELAKLPRNVIILKESYDELTEDEKQKLKTEYGEYSIFDRDIYIPIKDNRRKDSIYDGIPDTSILGFDVNNIGFLYYRSLFYAEKEGSNQLPNENDPKFSEKIKLVHENLKKSNKRKLMKAPIEKVVFNSIYALSQFSEMMYYTVNYTDLVIYTGIDRYPIDWVYPSYTWTNCLSNYCK